MNYIQTFTQHAEFLKALAHPRRLEIVHLLRDQELPVGDIHTMLDLPQANISQHLMILRKAHVVISRKVGAHVYYSLSDMRIIKASDLLREILISQSSSAALNGSEDLNMNELVPLTHDPVCKMRVSPKTASFSKKHKNTIYYFCASGCLKVFIESPKKYVS